VEGGREDGEGAEYKDNDDAVSLLSCFPAVEKSEEGEGWVRHVWGLLTVQEDDDDAVSLSCHPAVEKNEEGEERVRRMWGLLTVDSVSCRVVAIM
jgi:hypothetical protein